MKTNVAKALVVCEEMNDVTRIGILRYAFIRWVILKLILIFLLDIEELRQEFSETKQEPRERKCFSLDKGSLTKKSDSETKFKPWRKA